MAVVTWNNDGDMTTWSDGDNWDTNSPPGDGDDAVLTVGGGAGSIIFDEDHSAGGRNIQLASVSISGGVALSVKHDEDANTHLRIADGGDLSIEAGCTWQVGESGSPIAAGFTGKISFAPLSNGNCTINLVGVDSTFLAAGSAAWSRAGSAWVAEIKSAALAADDHIHIDTNLVPVVANDVDIFIEQTDGTYNHYDLMTSCAWTDEGGGSYKIEFDYNVVDAGDTDLNYGHAVGAKVYIVSRNVQIFSETAFGWTMDDDSAASLTTLSECYLRDNYRHNTKGHTSKFTRCAFYGLTGQNTFYLMGAAGQLLTYDNCLFLDAATSIYLSYGEVICESCHFHGVSNAFNNMSFLGLHDCHVSGTQVGANLRNMSADGCSFTGHLNQLSGRMRHCIIGATDHTSNRLVLSDCDTASMSAPGANSEVYSLNDNQVDGAVKAWVKGAVVEKQSTTKYSGDWALEITPYSNTSATNPLWVKVADIPCKGGTAITVTAQCAVNTAYGHASGDPSLVLDRGDCHGIETTVPWVLTSDSNPPEAADWEIATSGAQTPSGDGDDDIIVELWIKIPYYAAGAKVFVDDIQVTGASVDSDQISYWPGAQARAAAAGGGLLTHPGNAGGFNA